MSGDMLNKRTHRNTAILLLLLLSKPLAAATPPNVVYIISDDQAWTDFGFMGNKRVQTPNLDTLAKRSARFINGYVPSSVCRPSLATLLTGLYPHQHGIHFNHGPPGNAGYNRMTSRDQYEKTRRREFALIREVETLPGILRRERGYRSLQTGKFWEGHWRNGGFTEGMTTFEPPPLTQTFGGVRTLAGGQRVAHGNGDAGLQIGRRTMTPIYEFIDDCHGDGTPWMVWYAPYLPHQPHDAPKRFCDLARTRPDVAKHELPYFASIGQFDDTVGKLIRYVEKKGLAGNTIYVFAADNGWRPSHNRERNRPQEFSPTKRSKRAPFDDGLRTPILIRWDGIITPATHEALVSSIDLMPTLLAATGVTSELTTKFPGVNLLPVARGETETDANRAIFGEVYPGDASSLGHPQRDVAYRWVRKGNLKLIVPHTHMPDNKPWGDYLDSTALFDVAADPFETNNLAKSPTQRNNVAGLRMLLDDWWAPTEQPHAVTNPSSELMLNLPETGTDSARIAFDKLTQLPAEHTIVSDVRDRGGIGVNQHAYLARYDGRYWAMWSDGPGKRRANLTPEEHRNIVPGHDQADTRVSYATSRDGLNWSTPAELSGPPRIDGFGWIARGMWVRDGDLLALASHFNAPGYPGKGLSLEAFRWHKAKKAWEPYGTVCDDTLNNFPPKRLPSGQYMMTRRDHRRQVSVMIGGVRSFDEWKIRPLASYNGRDRPEEPYWYVLPDDRNIVGLIRDNGRSGRLLRTFSTDNGRTWSPIAGTNFPDATSKFFVLRTSRGYYAMASNANPHQRDPLTLAISRDGLVYRHLFYLIGDRHVDYPHIIEHDNHLLIAFSGAKQTVEVLRISLDDVDKQMSREEAR